MTESSNLPALRSIAVPEDEYRELKQLAAKRGPLEQRIGELENQLRQRGAEVFVSGIVSAMLSLIDNHDRAVAAARAANHVESIVAGLEVARHDVIRALGDAGIHEIEARPGDPFRLGWHDALGQAIESMTLAGTISRLKRAGWESSGEVIRPALVEVSWQDD